MYDLFQAGFIRSIGQFTRRPTRRRGRIYTVCVSGMACCCTLIWYEPMILPREWIRGRGVLNVLLLSLLKIANGKIPITYE